MVIKKSELKEIIRDTVSTDTEFGDEFVNMADSWSDAVEKKLKYMNKEDLKYWVEKAKEAKYQP